MRQVRVQLYKGNIFFQALTDVPQSIYKARICICCVPTVASLQPSRYAGLKRAAETVQEADSSMEASEGLNPVSSQGYAEIQRCEAIALAQAGLIRSEQYK